jgi:monoamine oxidase
VGTTESSPDVVIVGGGFAGVTAARELTMRGRSAVLVEARDRLGGRTYTPDHDGLAMELGGTWVHPLQPRVWAEIDRYGIELETFPVVEGLRQAVVSGGRVVDLSDDDVALGGRRGRRGRLHSARSPGASGDHHTSGISPRGRQRAGPRAVRRDLLPLPTPAA